MQSINLSIYLFLYLLFPGAGEMWPGHIFVRLYQTHIWDPVSSCNSCVQHPMFFFFNYLWSILGICLHQLIVIQVKKSMISLTLSLLKTTLTLNLVHVVPASWMSVWVWNYTLHRVIWDNVDPPYSSCH